MIDWSKSMFQNFEYYEVDPNTWKDKKIITNIKRCSISRDSEAETLGSASIDADNIFGECYIRVYLTVDQNGVKDKISLGVLLIQTPSTTFDGKIKNISMDAYTPLIELKEKKTPYGYSLLKNDNILHEAYLSARENMRAPVIETSSDKTLDNDFVANVDDNWLTFLIDLLYKAKYHFYLDEDGKVLFAPNQTLDELQPVWTYTDDNSSILFPEIQIKHDIYGIPNVVEVICNIGNEIYHARVVNNDPNSPTSTIQRGREIIYRETSPALQGIPTKEQVDEYAENLLKQLNEVEYELTYSHGYCPVRIGDCVRLNYIRAGLKDVKAKVIRQNIECDIGCKVSETARFSKNLWK